MLLFLKVEIVVKLYKKYRLRHANDLPCQQSVKNWVSILKIKTWRKRSFADKKIAELSRPQPQPEISTTYVGT